jgi:hypothetical protein
VSHVSSQDVGFLPVQQTPFFAALRGLWLYTYEPGPALYVPQALSVRSCPNRCSWQWRKNCIPGWKSMISTWKGSCAMNLHVLYIYSSILIFFMHVQLCVHCFSCPESCTYQRWDHRSRLSNSSSQVHYHHHLPAPQPSPVEDPQQRASRTDFSNISLPYKSYLKLMIKLKHLSLIFLSPLLSCDWAHQEVNSENNVYPV